MPANSGSTRITPLSCRLPLPLPPEHGRSADPVPLLWPGGAAPTDGHGVLTLAAFGGLEVGLGFGVGLGVDDTGCGVGAGVTRGDGAGLMAGVGAGVMAGVGAAGDPAVGAGVTIGTTGAPEARRAVGAGLGATDGLDSIDGDGLAADGLAVGGSEADPAGDEVGVPGTSVDPGVVGLVGGTTATGP